MGMVCPPNPSPFDTMDTIPIPSSNRAGRYLAPSQNSNDHRPNPSPLTEYSGLYRSISTQGSFDLFPSNFGNDTGIISESNNSHAVEKDDFFFNKDFFCYAIASAPRNPLRTFQILSLVWNFSSDIRSIV